jgi:[ribosomal protein S18]-alanine N-acetyltransferase
MGEIVRRAVPADLTRVQEIAAANSAAAQWSDKQYDTIFAERGEQNLVLVIENEQVEGFIVARLAGDQWEIENIAIDPEVQRQGKGSQLLCEFLEQARGRGTAVFLEVRQSNLTARKFYEKMGFAEAGRRKSYYREPAEDALILQLSF